MQQSVLRDLGRPTAIVGLLLFVFLGCMWCVMSDRNFASPAVLMAPSSAAAAEMRNNSSLYTGAIPRSNSTAAEEVQARFAAVNGVIARQDVRQDIRQDARQDDRTQRVRVQPAAAPPAPPRQTGLKQAKTTLVDFRTAPFSSPAAGVTGDTFGDPRVLLHIPTGFDITRPAVMVVFFHGHNATLQRDVMRRQQVPAQISASGINAVLVAPQFAVDAPTSNPGRFAEAGAFSRFADEAAKQLADLMGEPATARKFAAMPVVIVAYSGGYYPAAMVLSRGGLRNRVRGLVLLDALYGEVDRFASWISSRNAGFFVSAYTGSTRRLNGELERALAERNVASNSVLKQNIWRGAVTFLPAAPNAEHRDFVTRAWVSNPIKDLLTKL